MESSDLFVCPREYESQSHGLMSQGALKSESAILVVFVGSSMLVSHAFGFKGTSFFNVILVLSSASYHFFYLSKI